MVFCFLFCFPPFFSLPSPHRPQAPPGDVYPGGACTAASQCLRDYYNCRISECDAGVCRQVDSPAGTGCANLRNASNYDRCVNGMCLGDAYPSTFIQFQLARNTPSIIGNYSYPLLLQERLVEALSLSSLDKPSVRTCFDFTQRLVGTVQNGQQVIRTCNLILCPSQFISGPCSPYLYAEIISGPNNLNHTTLADQVRAISLLSLSLSSLFTHI